jgi:hypothetical protein
VAARTGESEAKERPILTLGERVEADRPLDGRDQVLQIPLGAHVNERQNGERRAVWERQPRLFLRLRRAQAHGND